MAEDHQQKSHGHQPTVADEGPVETKDRGLFDFLVKKEEEKPQEVVIATEFEKVKVSEPKPVKVEEQKEEEKKPGLFEKLHRSGSSSSSSSSDEEGEEGEGKKKKNKEKKRLKEKLKEKISGEKEEEDTTVPVEKCDEVPPVQEPAHPEEKKGFLVKIKDKLPGHHKSAEEVAPPPPPPAESATVEAPTHEGDAKEKKGILEKIKEKLPGYHPKEEKEKDKECASH